MVALTAGTAVIMWLGELLTEKGIGNGMSVLIFTSIAARIPAEGGAILQTRGGIVFALVCLLALLIIGAVVYGAYGYRHSNLGRGEAIATDPENELKNQDRGANDPPPGGGGTH